MPIFIANLWQTWNISIMCGMSNSSVVTRIMNVNNGDEEVFDTHISISSKNRITISTLFMKFNLFGLVIAWIQEAHAIRTPCSFDVCKNERWWFTNTNSTSILRMRNDAETILKSWVPLVPSLYCPWNDSTNMCRACNLRIHTCESTTWDTPSEHS